MFWGLCDFRCILGFGGTVWREGFTPGVSHAVDGLLKGSRDLVTRGLHHVTIVIFTYYDSKYGTCLAKSHDPTSSCMYVGTFGPPAVWELLQSVDHTLVMLWGQGEYYHELL